MKSIKDTKCYDCTERGKDLDLFPCRRCTNNPTLEDFYERNKLIVKDN